MSRIYNPNPLGLPSIVGNKQLDDGNKTVGVEIKGRMIVNTPIIKLVERTAKLDMINETVEWNTEAKLIESLQHALMHTLN